MVVVVAAAAAAAAAAVAAVAAAADLQLTAKTDKRLFMMGNIFR